MSILQSTNPVLSDSSLNRVFGAQEMRGAARTTTVSIAGVMAKTGFCTLLALATGAVGYSVTAANPGSLMMVNIIALVITLVIYFAIMAKPAFAMIGTPIYSMTQGFVMGGLAYLLDSVLKAQGIEVGGGVAIQAFIVTGASMAAMLSLHTFNIIRAGPRFTSILGVVTLGIALTYLASFIMSFFGASIPFLSLGSAMEGGSAAWIGLGINALVLVVAALWLLVDLQQVEQAAQSGAPKAMEWLLTFGLIVTLAWVFLEALKLVFRIALMFGNRD